MNDMAPVTPSAVPRKTSAAYGLLGLPLAFVALPVYVHLPNLYAQQYGVPLAVLGAVLLLSRSIDAVVDPWLGRWGDRLYRHSWQAVWVAALLLATVDGLVAGCCALRPLDGCDYANASEMKRLYVRSAFRGFGLGRELASRTLDLARQAGYSHVLLDTLDDMEAARSLYLELGFEEIPPYYHNPIAGAHYLKVDL